MIFGIQELGAEVAENLGWNHPLEITRVVTQVFVTRATRHVMRAITPCYACHPDTLRTRPSVAMYPSTLHR